MRVEENDNFGYIPTMPDGRAAPTVLTPEETADFLRCKNLGISNPDNTLRYYIDKGLLRPTCIGNKLAFTSIELCKFLSRLTQEKKKTKRR